MPKFYKVSVRNENSEIIAKAIVSNSLFGVEEIVTRHSMDKFYLKNAPFSMIQRFVEKDKRENGWYGFVAREDLKKENIATREEVIKYVDNFEISDFKNLFGKSTRPKVKEYE